MDYSIYKNITFTKTDEQNYTHHAVVSIVHDATEVRHFHRIEEDIDLTTNVTLSLTTATIIDASGNTFEDVPVIEEYYQNDYNDNSRDVNIYYYIAYSYDDYRYVCMSMYKHKYKDGSYREDKDCDYENKATDTQLHKTMIME